MSQRRFFLGMFQRRECIVPTWRGLLVALAIVCLGGWLFATNVYTFLAVNEPSPGGVLVIEGWAADYTMGQAVEEFRAHPYDVFLVTGGPIDKGAPFSQFKTYAELGEATIERLGVPPEKVQAVPAPEVDRDRTYASALALKEWLQANHLSTKNINVLTMGWHARRSRLLYQRAFGPESVIGITALETPDDRRKPWWKTSVGVRGVINEVLAYFYARFLFNPDRA